MVRLKYPETNSEKVLFRDRFFTTTYVEDNDGVLTNSPPVDNGVTLNGINQYITYPPLDTVGLSDYTVYATINTSHNTGYPYIIGTSAPSKWLPLYVSQTGLLRMGIGVYYYSPTGGSVVSDGKDHFVAVSVDRNGYASFYVDGVLDGTVSVASSASTDITDTSNLLVGYSYTGGINLFAGKITNCQIVLGTRTAEEILDIYNNTLFDDIDADNLLFSLPFNSYYKHTDNKYYTINKGTNGSMMLADDGTTTGKFPEVVDNHFYFDGGRQLITETTELDYTQHATFGVIMTVEDNAYTRYVGYQAPSSTNRFLVYVSSSDAVYCYLGGKAAGVSQNSSVRTSTSVPMNAWCSVMVVFDGTLSSTERIRIYINGVKQPIIIAGTIPDTFDKLSDASWNAGINFYGNMKNYTLSKNSFTETQVREWHNRNMRRIVQ